MRQYDLVMTHKLDADDFFIHRIQQHCAERGLNFFLIEPVWAGMFYEKLKRGEVSARVLLNMHSEHHQPEDLFHQLVELADERGAQVIDPPKVARAAFDKAEFHGRLREAGFRLPFTLIVPRETAQEWRMNAGDRQRLGEPFVIKPSLGYGKRGVILDGQSEADLRRSMELWLDPKYLVQEKIIPRRVGERPAYFRVFYVFGTIWLCWWNCYTDQYRVVKPEEVEDLGLHPLQEIGCRLAAVSGMRFFSTELAQTEAGEFILIDYLNDQCHMLTQSANPAMGVPDEIVAGIARRLVEGSQRLMRGGLESSSSRRV